MFNQDEQKHINKITFLRNRITQAFKKNIISEEEYNHFITYLNDEEILFFLNTPIEENIAKVTFETFFDQLKENIKFEANTFKKLRAYFQLKELVVEEFPLEEKVTETIQEEVKEKIEPEIEIDKEVKKKIYFEDLLEDFSGKWLVVVGVLLIVFSSYPVIKSMNSTSLIFAILQLYSTGLFIAGYFIRKYLPWTGNVFYNITLLITPIILSSINSLNFSNFSDLLIAIFSIIAIPFMNYKILKTFYEEFSKKYFFSFIASGLFYFISLNIQELTSRLGFLKADFETIIIMLIGIPLYLGFSALTKKINLTEKTSNLQSILIMELLLIYQYFIILFTNNYDFSAYGLLATIIAAISLLNMKVVKKANPIAFDNNKTLTGLSTFSIELLLVSPFVTYGDISKLVFTSFIAFALFIQLLEIFQSKAYKLFIDIVSGVFFNVFILFLLLSWSLSADKQSVFISFVTLLLVVVANIKPFEKTKNSFYNISLITSATVWLKIAIFDIWSEFTFISLFFLSSIYFFNSFHYKRNVLSYIASTTFFIAYLSLISIVNPNADFDSYRYYAVLLSFLYLAIGYFVQTRYKGKTINLEKANVSEAVATIPQKKNYFNFNYQKFFTEDIVKPYDLQGRFASIIPYLISEPLYNTALLMTSLAVMVNLRSYTIALLATIFYVAIFKIYPSRLWIYFAITSATGGLMSFILDVLPPNYHTWSFIFVSFNWFFIGILVEELFEAYERKKGNLLHKDQKFAQPFFQGAIAVNIFMLRYFLVDLQDISTPEGWQKIQDELLQLFLISFLYVLKIRSYLSKLWLYPCIVIVSLVLYFKAIALFGFEYNLTIITSIGFVFLGLGTLFNKSKRVISYLKNILEAKVPNLDFESNYYKYHIRDFGEPFYTFAFLAVMVSFITSVIFIPRFYFMSNQDFIYPENITSMLHSYEFYFSQLVNFILMGVFFLLYYPKKVPILTGGYEERPYPKALIFLPPLAFTFELLWIFNSELNMEKIILLLASASFIWSLVYLNGVVKPLEKLFPKKLSLEKDFLTLEPYKDLSLALVFFSFVLMFFVPSDLNLYSSAIITIVLISFGLNKKNPEYLYFIEATSFFSTTLLLKSLGFESAIVISLYLYSFINLAFMSLTKKFFAKTKVELQQQENLIGNPSAEQNGILKTNKVLQDLTYLSSVSILVHLFNIETIVSNSSELTKGVFNTYNILALLFYFVLAIRTQLPYFSFITLTLYFLFLVNNLFVSIDYISFTDNIFPLLSLISSISLYYVYAKVKAKVFEPFKLSLLFYSIVFPVFPIYLILSKGNIDYAEFILFAYAIYYAFVAKPIKHNILKKVLWWFTAILSNTFIVLIPNLIRFLETKGLPIPSFYDYITPTQAFSISAGLSLLLLSKTEENIQRKKNYLYVGQIVLVLLPYIYYKSSYVYSEALLYLSEFIIINTIFVISSLKIKSKTILYATTTFIMLFILSELAITFIKGDWFVKWSILLILGIITTIFGVQLDVRKEQFKKLFSDLSKKLESWS